MNYLNLPDSNFYPLDFNNKKFITKRNVQLLFQIQLQISQCNNLDYANKFIQQSQFFPLFFLCKQNNSQKYDLQIKSYYFSFDYLKYNMKKLLKFTELALNSNYRGHQTDIIQNMKIKIKSNDLTDYLKRKIDIVINSHPDFIKKISRRKKIGNIQYNLLKKYDQFGTNYKNSPLQFKDNIITFNMFRSTLKMTTILSTIQFCKLIFEFCKDNITIDNIMYNQNYENNFNNYIKKYSKFFYSYMVSLNIEFVKEFNHLFYNESINSVKNCSDVILYNINTVEGKLSNDRWKIYI